MISHNTDVIENPYYGENEVEISNHIHDKMDSLGIQSDFSPVTLHKDFYNE